MARKDRKYLMEVVHYFDPDTYLSVARRIVAVIGKQCYGSNRVMAFSFSTEDQRTAAMEKLAEEGPIGKCAVTCRRVEAMETNAPRDEQAWTCTCGYQSFLLRGDGAIVCWTCNRVQERVMIRDSE